jgi:archaellum component FlaF (FlaF/FlaG flagellin family)
MEHSIPALLIASIMILAGVLIADVTTSSVDNMNQGWREMEAISEERLGTDLTVVSTQLDGTNTLITAVIQNDGRTALSEFEAMDIIINYEGSDTQRYINWLSYEEAVLQDNTWTVASVAGDYRNPGVLDAGEQMTIRIQVNPSVASAPERWFVLATDTGVSYTVYF